MSAGSKPWDSWVYVFSKFTSEALIFEVLFILLLLTLYSAYWVLRKRKHGVLHEFSNVPPSVVKDYLSALMMDAEQMRAQLFGLLGGVGGSPVGFARPGGDFSAALAALEAKMAEQAKAMEALLAEKAKLEAELAAARAGGGGGTGDNPELAEKIKQLESRLAEYSVIEDDLANLKRLQQENKQLKSQLSGAGAQPAPAAPAPAAAPAVAAPAPAAVPEAVAAAPAQAAPTQEPSFEGMVDQVEQTLEPAAAAPAADASAASAEAPPVEAAPVEAPEPAPAAEAVAAPAQAPEPAAAEPPAGATAAPPAAASNDAPAGDDDLVAEFEKMLSG